MEYVKQLNKISKIINEIPYKHVYIEIETEQDRYTLDKDRKAPAIGFRVGDKIE